MSKAKPKCKSFGSESPGMVQEWLGGGNLGVVEEYAACFFVHFRHAVLISLAVQNRTDLVKMVEYNVFS